MKCTWPVTSLFALALAAVVSCTGSASDGAGAAARSLQAAATTGQAAKVPAPPRKTDGIVVTPRTDLPIFKGPIAFVLPDAPCPATEAKSPPVVSSVIAAPPLLDYEAPEYPAAARERKAVGVVFLEIEIGADGRVKATKRLRSDNRWNPDQELVDAAIRAVKKWRFARACFDGVAVPLIHVVGVRFPPD